MRIISYPYADINDEFDEVTLLDHLNGFTSTGTNSMLDVMNAKDRKIKVVYHQILSDKIKDQYKNLDICFSATLQRNMNFRHFEKYNIHPIVHIKNFLCSFNGSPHVSRQLLVSALHVFGLFDSDYCSKTFSISSDEIENHISFFLDDDDSFYRKFFVNADFNDFAQTINEFKYERFAHASNIYTLEHKLTQSFVHLVSETLATSYHPFVTEKFLYSIVTRGLFLSYAQPGWHKQIEKYYGFKLYTKLFDYSFDLIDNPVKRLVELITMISKFSKLSYDDLYDIYLIELDTINYNYDHYFSGRYLEHLKQYGTNI